MLKPSPYILIILITSIFVIGGGSACLASPPINIYEKNKNVILDEGLYIQGTDVFSVGWAKPSSHSALSRKICRKKAHTRAQVGFFRAVKNKIDWPDDMNLSLRDKLFNAYISFSTSSLHLGGVTKIDEFTSKKKCICILHTKKTEIDIKPIVFSDLVYLFKKLYIENDNFNARLYFEICDKSKINSVLMSLSDVFCKQYGENVKDVILGEKIKKLPDFWRRGRLLTYEEIADFELEQLLKLLNYSPYDPVVSYVIGNKFSKIGYIRLASLFYARGTTWLINPVYNKLCRDLMKDNFFIQKIEILSQQERKLHQKAMTKISSNDYVFDGVAKLVFLSYGTLPLVESSPVRQISLSTDGINLNDYLNIIPTSKGFSEVSRHFKDQGNWIVALPFAIQASQMDRQYTVLHHQILNRISKGVNSN